MSGLCPHSGCGRPDTRAVRAHYQSGGGIRIEVGIGSEHGHEGPAIISCDNVITVAKPNLDPDPIGHLDVATFYQLLRTGAALLDREPVTLIPPVRRILSRGFL